MDNQLLDELAEKIYPGPVTPSLEAALHWGSPQAERLEYLGDAMLELAASAYLYKMHANATPGQLTKRRTNIVNQQALAHVGRRLGLDRIIETRESKITDSMLEDTVEAIVGAMFEDFGYRATERFCVEMFGKMGQATHVQAANMLRAAKGILQTFCHRQHQWPIPADRRTPKYSKISQTGPSHNPEIVVRVEMYDGRFAEGHANQRDIAEQTAALTMLNALEASGELARAGISLE